MRPVAVHVLRWASTPEDTVDRIFPSYATSVMAWLVPQSDQVGR
jgi:hypothetical protein